MKKIIIKVVVALFLTLASGLLTTQETPIPLDRDDRGVLYSTENPGGGVAYVSDSAGFPLDYIENQNKTLDYEANYLYLSFNFLFWFAVTHLAFVIHRRLHENSRD